jgi:hypothetical protein
VLLVRTSSTTDKDWVGCPLGLLKETQYRPMLSPLIHTSPFPILLRFSVTGSFPHGMSNVVCTVYDDGFLSCQLPSLRSEHMIYQDLKTYVNFLYLVPDKWKVRGLINGCPLSMR